MSSGRQFCTFFADRFHFAIDVDHVQEVLHPMPVTLVPLTSEVVDGLVNLRGQIVTAIDLRARLALPRREEQEPSVSLIARTSSGLISLRADRLGDVLDADSLTSQRPIAAADSELKSKSASDQQAVSFRLEALPDTVQGPVREVALGIIQLEESLLLVLDPDQLLTAAVSLRGSETDR